MAQLKVFIAPVQCLNVACHKVLSDLQIPSPLFDRWGVGEVRGFVPNHPGFGENPAFPTCSARPLELKSTQWCPHPHAPEQLSQGAPNEWLHFQMFLGFVYTGSMCSLEQDAASWISTWLLIKKVGKMI